MRSLALLFSATFVFATVSLHAQAPADPAVAPAIKVDIKKVTVIEQPTPQFSGGGVKEKRWRPKNWVEVDVEIDVKLPQNAGGSKGTYAGLQMNLYLATNFSTKETPPKRQVLSATFNLINIAAGECHVLAYVSPATMKSISQKDTVLVSTDIQGWGVEVIAEGNRLAGDSSIGKGPWWETGKDTLAILQGMLVHKSQTPFAILWPDYDLAIAPK